MDANAHQYSNGFFIGGVLTLASVPVINMQQSIAAKLRQISEITSVHMSIAVNATSKNVSTLNVFAEFEGDSKSKELILIGAHLDSVIAGPGINDNGSGSATILQMALLMKKNKVKPYNKVRFAWWAAEEDGKLGSKFFVDECLKIGNLSQVTLYLNYGTHAHMRA